MYPYQVRFFCCIFLLTRDYQPSGSLILSSRSREGSGKLRGTSQASRCRNTQRLTLLNSIHTAHNRISLRQERTLRSLTVSYVGPCTVQSSLSLHGTCLHQTASEVPQTRARGAIGRRPWVRCDRSCSRSVDQNELHVSNLRTNEDIHSTRRIPSD
jgi:hypothetical protein